MIVNPARDMNSNAISKGGYPGPKLTRPYADVCIIEGERALKGEWESPRDATLEETGYVNVDKVQMTISRKPGSKHIGQSGEQAEIALAIDDLNVISWSEMDNGRIEMDAIVEDEAEYVNMNESLSKSDSQYQNTTQITEDRSDTSNAKDDSGEYQRLQGNCIYTLDAAIEEGIQEDCISSKINTPLDVDASAVDEYIDMKMKRQSVGDKQPLDSEQKPKPTIQASIKSCLMKNKEFYELSKLPGYEMKLESLISDITEVCQQAINEKDVVGTSHENDDHEAETENLEHHYLEMLYSQPHYVVEDDENLSVGGGSVDVTQNCTEVTFEAFLENKSYKVDHQDYDYAYNTKQSIHSNIVRSNESLTESNEKDIASFRCSNSSQKNHRAPENREMSEVNKRNRMDGSMASQTTDSNTDADGGCSYSYAYSERLTFLDEVFRMNARDATATITESQSHYSEDESYLCPLETVTKKSEKLLQWAVESGIRRVRKSKYSAEDDKIFINSYEDIDTIPITNESSGYSFCDNLKLKLIVGCLFILSILIAVFLIIIYPKL